jgi:Arc/MetJ-type ribon-helix-helix transcriptional regulator
MKLFTVKLTDEHRAKLEALRKVMGLRSESDVVRALIDGAIERREPVHPTLGPVKTVLLTDGKYEGPEVTVAAGETLVVKDGRKKPETFKTRLKGEWKAP